MDTRYWDAIPEIQVSYKRPKNKSPVLRNSQDSYEAFLSIWDMDLIDYVEEFKILLLSKANHILGVVHLSKGGIASVVVDVRVIFGVALKAAACSIIAAHNHPSGNLKPSDLDMKLTRKLTEAGKLVEIKILDHLIISREGYYSFADEGLN